MDRSEQDSPIEAYPPDDFAPRVVSRTPRTRAVIAALEAGFSVSETARMCEVSHSYVSQLSTKLGLRSKREFRTIPNPWGLTDRQYKLMLALCQTGHIKVAASRCGIVHRTAERAIYDSKRVIGERSLIKALIVFDRFVRQGVEQ